jgi:hypothetical protein
VTDWLGDAQARLSEASGVEASDLQLDPRQVEELLDLARVAAHESGERTNAPLVCYLAGLAHARGRAGLTELVRAVVRDG